MKYDIEAAILRQTVKCTKQHSCLSSGIFGDKLTCQASDMNGPNVIFLSKVDHVSCDYRINFGSGQLCTCPVRYAVHQKYGLHQE